MRTLWSAAAGFCFLGLAGCQQTQAKYAQNTAERWLRIATIEATHKGKYEMMCDAYRQSVPIETFAGALERNAYLNAATGWQILEGDSALAVEAILWTRRGR